MYDSESSKLLIDEEPLQVLPGLAAVIGLNEALVVQQLHYWLRRSKHEHDGRKWIYNTLGEWQVQFPFWNEATLQRTMKSLIAINLVKVHKFNRNNWDRTNWYTINYPLFRELETRAQKILAEGETKKGEIEQKRRQRGLTILQK